MDQQHTADADREWGDEWERVVDLVVVGSGAAGSSAAATAAGLGATVLVLDKAAFTGGTTAKSGGVMWVPDNPVMRADGIADDRWGALRYMARTGYPTRYRADDELLGLPPTTFGQLAAFYDRGADVLARLAELGAWELEAVPYPDYYADLPEDLAPIGRVVQPRFPDGWRRGVDPTGGQLLSDALLGVATARGAEVRTGAEVRHVVADDGGRIVGVEARVGVRTALYGARRGVVFASGGFAHDRDLVLAHLRGPLLGSGASASATGDFVRIGIEAGARLGNMSHAWWDQVVVEHAITVPSTVKDVYSPFGDSMLMVNRHGRRVVDEKAPYNERGQVHFTWDAQRCEYPNLLLFWIFDQAVVDDPTESRFRWPVPLPGEPFPDFVVSAERLEDLGDELARRLARLADHTGGVTLADGFVPELRRTIARFGEHARAGDDPDFGRGRSRISQAWAGAPRAGFPNPTLAALAAAGPFHCVILGPGALDTKGGPATDEHGRVLSVAGEPIPGLYGAGNCIASPAGQAYWGPGGTIGPAVVFGAIAAEHALTR